MSTDTLLRTGPWRWVVGEISLEEPTEVGVVLITSSEAEDGNSETMTLGVWVSSWVGGRWTTFFETGGGGVESWRGVGGGGASEISLCICALTWDPAQPVRMYRCARMHSGRG